MQFYVASRQCMLAMELEDIEREKFDGWVAKHQICQYFPPSKNCAIWYVIHCKYTTVNYWIFNKHKSLFLPKISCMHSTVLQVYAPPPQMQVYS